MPVIDMGSINLVGPAGLEPAPHCWEGILSPPRLPIPPQAVYHTSEVNQRLFGGQGGTRTHIDTIATDYGNLLYKNSPVLARAEENLLS